LEPYGGTRAAGGHAKWLERFPRGHADAGKLNVESTGRKIPQRDGKARGCTHGERSLKFGNRSIMTDVRQSRRYGSILLVLAVIDADGEFSDGALLTSILCDEFV